MAERDILGCLEKRDLLNQNAVSVENLLFWGKRYEEAGLLSDAVDFYEKAKATDALNRLLENAKEEGDFFLFNRLSRILNFEGTSDDWMYLARQAEKAGKFTFAAQAALRADSRDAPEK
ncbi:MAG: hypothetical protein GX433_18505 [Deltaproteobacteria bacterium]|jgi:hypothetical protein|uniref:Uncharacterized protein n=1 Tax=Desulforhabdus amnigena TaxID=40218 RepID=A0A9W6D4Q2_9BACT|nr:hypothetical protein [Deltaproteobacteria bacterium]GLI34090.1 hypothetical protein DAMNIGENAA_15230 [Desulforhabdus amnigena]